MHNAERILFYGALTLCLTGCADLHAPVSYTTSAFVRNEELAHVPGALEATIVAFTGVSAGPSLVAQVPPDFLTQSTRPAGTSKTSYRQKRSQQAGVRLTALALVTPRVVWTSSVAGSVGASDFLLPDGAGVLVEPIAIRFRTINVEVDTGLGYNVPVTSRATINLSAKAGLRMTHAKTRIDSPVLAARHDNLQSLPYAAIGSGITLSPRNSGRLKNTAFLAEIRHYPDFGDAGVSIGAELSLNF